MMDRPGALLPRRAGPIPFMRHTIAILLLASPLTFGQGRGARTTAAPDAAAPPAAAANSNREFVRENYTKFEYRIPMRDGVKLFTSVYVPKDVFTEGRTYPIM